MHKPTVVSSIFVLHDLVRRVGGAHVQAELLLSPGLSAHGYAPSPKLTGEVARAKLLFAIGLSLDGWATDLARARGVPFVELGAELAQGDDPHVWLSPSKALQLVTLIERSVSASFPTHRAAFAENAERTRKSLTALRAEIAKTTARLRKRTFVTMHDAFAYFAEELDLRVAAVIQSSPDDAVLRVMRGGEVAAVFTEPQLDARRAEVLAAKAGLPIRELDPIGGVAGRDSYEALMRYNLAQLSEAMR